MKMKNQFESEKSGVTNVVKKAALGFAGNFLSQEAVCDE